MVTVAASGDSADFPFDAGPTALHAAARVLKPCGTSSRRSTALENGRHAGTARNSLDGSREFYEGPSLGAGPRAARRAARLAPLPAARAAAGDNENSARDGRIGLVLIFATAALPAIAASGTPPAGIPRCNIGLECHRAVQKGPLRGEIGSEGGVEGYHRYRRNCVQALLFAVG